MGIPSPTFHFEIFKSMEKWWGGGFSEAVCVLNLGEKIIKTFAIFVLTGVFSEVFVSAFCPQIPQPASPKNEAILSCNQHCCHIFKN